MHQKVIIIQIRKILLVVCVYLANNCMIIVVSYFVYIELRNFVIRLNKGN